MYKQIQATVSRTEHDVVLRFKQKLGRDQKAEIGQCLVRVRVGRLLSHQ